MIDHKNLSRVLFGSSTRFCGPLAATSVSGRKLTIAVLQIQRANVDVVNINHRGGSYGHMGQQPGLPHRLTGANKATLPFSSIPIRVIDEAPVNDDQLRRDAWEPITSETTYGPMRSMIQKENTTR